ncbi:MAG: substrate-binding domain-containing protein [Pirellulaceae bacterium]|jgi:phosphate transport system substrate-binding protein|nr:substrate-binding domain-containing protein [Pirellulaceae bacterium]
MVAALYPTQVWTWLVKQPRGHGHSNRPRRLLGGQRRPALRPVIQAIAVLAWSLATPVAAQQPTGLGESNRAATSSDSSNRGSAIEQLTAMLKSIEPYRPQADVTQTIHVVGSTSMDALANGWVNGFKQFHPNSKVEISGAGSGDTAKMLAANPTAIAMYSRPVPEQELEELRKLGLKQPTAFMVAREALTVFVNSSNPTTSISGEKVRDLFTTDNYPDELTWSAVGATGGLENEPLHVIARTRDSGTQLFLSEYVFSGSHMRSPTASFSSNAEVLEALSNDPLGIAICGYRSSGRLVKPLQLDVGGTIVPCDDLAVLSGRYPLMRPLTLVIDLGQSDAKAKASQEFVRYAMCQAGQTQAILVGFFPVDLPLLRAGLENLNAQTIR